MFRRTLFLVCPVFNTVQLLTGKGIREIGGTELSAVLECSWPGLAFASGRECCAAKLRAGTKPNY